MNNNVILVSIIIISAGLITFLLIKRRPDLLVSFALRACMGTAGIYLLDTLLNVLGSKISVGVNAVTVLANGFLGLPGFLLVYGLAVFYSFQ